MCYYLFNPATVIYVAPSKKPTLVLLVRHGRTPTTGIELYGRKPGVHLSEEGKNQANRILISTTTKWHLVMWISVKRTSLRSKKLPAVSGQCCTARQPTKTIKHSWCRTSFTTSACQCTSWTEEPPSYQWTRTRKCQNFTTIQSKYATCQNSVNTSVCPTLSARGKNYPLGKTGRR